jgi:hypothetical protein
MKDSAAPITWGLHLFAKMRLALPPLSTAFSAVACATAPPFHPAAQGHGVPLQSVFFRQVLL